MSRKKTLERKAYVKNGALRLLLCSIVIIAEFLWLYIYIARISVNTPLNAFLRSAVSLLIALLIYGRRENSSMKMLWLFIVLSFPVMGIVLYLIAGLSGATRAMHHRFEQIHQALLPWATASPSALPDLSRQYPHLSGQFYSLEHRIGSLTSGNTQVRFFGDTADALEVMLQDLSRAEKFIFMEYHAIEDARVFSRIHAVLAERAAAGVEVRLFYDDIGSIFFINTDFADRMEQDGIHCRYFNPMLPLVNFFMNHRDHRKITVIDGRIGYTGGYNLADEYFHLTEPYGYWKDSGVRLEGGAVASMTALFLEMWNAIRSHDEDDAEFSRYFPAADFPEAQGYVLAYGESPLDALNTAEDVFINLLAGAQKYAWFTTPYLILTDEMARALVLAAGRGVDVRIITPNIPDKKLTFRVTRSYYRELVSGGVRIYEYTPGFIHAKQCVSDDLVAICGTINLDYRSLYHHFENGVLMLNTPAVTDIREDFVHLFSQSHEVTARYLSRTSFPFRLRDALLHLIAPLL